MLGAKEAEVPRVAGWVAWMGDASRFWSLFTVVLGIFAALKGLREPGTWCFTQSLVDYSHGFVKRGLLGAIYGAFGIVHQRTLSMTYFVELGLLLLLLAVFTRRSGLVERVGTGAVPALFAGSYAVTYLFHIVGYSDIPDAAIAVGLLLVRAARLRFLLALPLLVAGLLIHEGFLLLFTPVLLLSFFLEGLEWPQGRRRVWSFGLILAVVAGAVTSLTSLRAPMSPEQVDAFADSIWNRADFVVREDFFQVLTNSLAGNLQMMSSFGWHQYLWWTYQAVSICVLGPALVLLLHFCMRLVRQRSPEASGPGQRKWVRLAVLLGIFSPLLLHLVGLDQVRWNSWVLVDAYLALGVLSMHLPGEQLVVSAAERNALILVITVGMASGYGLFNDAQVNPYPFFPKLMGEAIKQHDKPLTGFSGAARTEQ